MIVIFDNIVRLAKDKKINIKKLEEEAKLANGTIGKWRKSKPMYWSLKKVADVLGVTVEELDKE